MSNKKWDNDIAEFLVPKGLLIRVLVTAGLCFLIIFIVNSVEGSREKKKAEALETLKEEIQTPINHKQFSEAEELLDTYIHENGSSDATDEIAIELLNNAVHGCWKGYGEWKTEIHDSSGERFLYFYYPGPEDPLYVSGEQETYYLFFSETELSDLDEVKKECQNDPGVRYLLSGVERHNYNHIMHDGVVWFRCYEAESASSSDLDFSFSYFFKDDSAEIGYKANDVKLERME